MGLDQVIPGERKERDLGRKITLAPEFSPKESSRSCPVTRFLGAEVKGDEQEGHAGDCKWPKDGLRAGKASAGYMSHG